METGFKPRVFIIPIVLIVDWAQDEYMDNHPESFPELGELLFPKITKVARFIGNLFNHMGHEHPDPLASPVEQVTDWPGEDYGA